MNSKIVLSIATIFSLSTLEAIDFKPIGFKSIGMGGTGVASTRGSLSGYYNPALLKYSDYTTEISLNTDVRIRESNLIDNMDSLNKIDFQTTIDALSNNAESGNIFVEAAIVNGNLITAQNNITLSTAQINTINGLNNGQSITINAITFTKVNNSLLTYSQSGQSNSDTVKKNIEDAVDIITQKIGSRNAFLVSATPSLATQISDSFAIGLYGNADLGLKININEQYNKLIFKQQNNDGTDLYYAYNVSSDRYEVKSGDNARQEYESSSLEYANNNNINRVNLNSIVLAELPISYARSYDFNDDSWSFGVNLKPMQLISYERTIRLGESSSNADDGLEDLETTYKSSIGIDFGLAYQPKDSDLTIGFVAKNVNTPTFKVSKSKTGITQDYQIKPMVRAGLSVPFWDNNIEFAFDVDVTKNESLFNEESQYIGTGFEFHPVSWFTLRTGAMQDIASEQFDDGTIMTFGVGFGLKWVQIDLSAMASTKSGEYDGRSIPRYSAFNIALVSRWGDGYNGKNIKRIEDNI